MCGVVVILKGVRDIYWAQFQFKFLVSTSILKWIMGLAQHNECVITIA